MEKIVIHGPGGYERLKLEEHPTPNPKPGEVLIRTEASGVNYADVAVRWGLYESAKKYVGWPITPGFEYAGTVERIGDGVIHLKTGDRVFGITRFGAYSTHVVVPGHQVFPLPTKLSYEEGAGFPAVYMTAYHALFQNVIVRKGMTLLVHSAAGGVGTALLQLGKIAGCKVVGVVGSSHKVETASKFGADHVIDKSKEDLWKRAEQIAPQGYDVILDANGVSTLKQSYKHLAPTGKLISYGFHSMLPKSGGRVNYLALAWNYLRTPRFNPIQMTNENRSLITFNVSFLFDRTDLLEEGMRDLMRWTAEGKLQAPKVTCYALDDVAKAHQDIESGSTTGKLILSTQKRARALVH
ncbi:MAG: medium chain dehydrogenase/reductase family protein [Bdellovibrionota bacterium]